MNIKELNKKFKYLSHFLPPIALGIGSIIGWVVSVFTQEMIFVIITGPCFASLAVLYEIIVNSDEL